MESSGQMDNRGLIHAISKTVQDTKQLAKEISVSKSNFLMLAFYLGEIQTVADDFTKEDEQLLNSLPLWTALSRLEGITDTVYRFIKVCGNRSRIFLLYKVANLLDSLREIVKNLADGLSSIADALPVDHRVSFVNVKEKLCRASFYMEPGHQQMVEEIKEGLASHHVDEPYATALLRRISELLSVPLSTAAELKLELLRDLEHSGFAPGDPDYNELESLCKMLNPAAVLEDVRRLAVEESAFTRYDLLPVYSSFICPITGQLMQDPVMLVEAGFTYEREAICEWFQRGHRTCPDTGNELESLELVPNVRLRQAITEYVDRATHKSLKKAVENIRESGETTEVEEAVDLIKSLSETNPNNKHSVAKEMDGIPALIGIVKRYREKMPELVEKAMKLMFNIASMGDEYRIIMIDEGLVPVVIHYLWKTDKATTLGFQLLHEISQIEPGRKAILDLEKKALMTISQGANGSSEESKSLAEKILHNLCQETPSVAIAVAQYQVFRPLISMMSADVPMDIRAEMATAVVDLQSKDCGYALLIKAGVIVPLLDLLQNGQGKREQIAAARTLHSLSASESNRVDLCNAGAIPALVKFMSASEQDLRVAIMGALANLATDHRAVIEMDQEGAISRLIGMLQLDSLVHEFALRTLQCMARTSKTVRLSIKGQDVGPYFLTLLHKQRLNPSCRASALSLICHLVDDEESRPCIVLSQDDIDVLLSFLGRDLQTEEHESILGIVAGMSDAANLRRDWLQSDKVLLVLVKFLEGGSLRCQEYASVALSKLLDPSYISTQKQLLIAKSGGIPLLVRLLKEGSVRTKCASAAALGLLSRSTPGLTRKMSLAKRLVSLAGVSSFRRCKVHAGKCSAKDTMCLVESGAAVSLLRLLEEKEQQSAEKAMEALATLIADENSARGVEFLVKNGLIPMLIAVLGRSDGLTDKAAKMIERIVRDRRFRDERYWQGAQNALCLVIATGIGEARRSAASSLELLGLVPKGTTYTR